MNAPTFQQESSERPGISKLLLELEADNSKQKLLKEKYKAVARNVICENADLRRKINKLKQTGWAVLGICISISFVTLVVVRI